MPLSPLKGTDQKGAKESRLHPFVMLPNSETLARDRTLREKDGKTGGPRKHESPMSRGRMLMYRTPRSKKIRYIRGFP
jgi:hypothetical protein